MNELKFKRVNEGNNDVFMNELGLLHEYLSKRFKFTCINHKFYELLHYVTA